MGLEGVRLAMPEKQQGVHDREGTTTPAEDTVFTVQDGGALFHFATASHEMSIHWMNQIGAGKEGVVCASCRTGHKGITCAQYLDLEYRTWLKSNMSDGPPAAVSAKQMALKTVHTMEMSKFSNYFKDGIVDSGYMLWKKKKKSNYWVRVFVCLIGHELYVYDNTKSDPSKPKGTLSLCTRSGVPFPMRITNKRPHAFKIKDRNRSWHLAPLDSLSSVVWQKTFKEVIANMAATAAKPESGFSKLSSRARVCSHSLLQL